MKAVAKANEKKSRSRAKSGPGPLKIPLKFDDAMRRAVQVRPPLEGWAQYERNLKTTKPRPKKTGIT
jgi:hypothetical protein